MNIAIDPGPRARVVKQLRGLCANASEVWKSDRAPRAPDDVTNAVKRLPSSSLLPLPALVTQVSMLLRDLVSNLDTGAAWVGPNRRILIAGLKSAYDQVTYSQETNQILAMVDAINETLGAASVSEGSPSLVAVQASLWTLEDAQVAIECYSRTERFLSWQHAYLDKFGLLQALQLQASCVQEVGRNTGKHIRFDRLPGVAAALEARSRVAGHPLTAIVHKVRHRHFHDRASVHDPSVLRVMSFAKADPTSWAGATYYTADLIKWQAHAVVVALTRIRDHLLGLSVVT